MFACQLVVFALWFITAHVIPLVLSHCNFSILSRSYSLLAQLIDDTLDFSSSTAQLGKPGFADLRLGLATGPALYAAEEFPELEAMIERRFGRDGDVETVSTASR
jgi:geranylgeranyl pyrophosphate synthase